MQRYVFNKLYLDGVKGRLLTFNAVMVSDGKSPLFCVPPKMAMTVDQAEDIMEREAKTAGNSAGGIPISILLLAGLRETFPCAAK